MKKKIIWIVLLIIILVAMIVGISVSRKQEAKVATTDTTFGKNTVSNTEASNTNSTEVLAALENTKSTESTVAKSEENATNVENAVNENTTISNNTETTTVAKETKSGDYVVTKLSDGTLYSKEGKEIKPDIIIDEKYFDTTINDIWLNPKSYMNKNIQIEGMYLENLPYTFVGRYSTSNICPNCPAGYSYFEYQLDGNLDKKFTDEKEWIKVIGTLEVGNDESTNYTDFYYIKVLSLEVMNKRGNDTVNN